jgi:hypothetical protein
MASRTNKMWILKKKRQLEKIKILKTKKKYNLKHLSETEKISQWLIFDKKNPKWKKYTRDKSWRKIICKQTWLREDFDGYRLIFKPNSSDAEYVFSWFNSRLNKKIKRLKKNR